jgi:hypothetical protein
MTDHELMLIQLKTIRAAALELVSIAAELSVTLSQQLATEEKPENQLSWGKPTLLH